MTFIKICFNFSLIVFSVGAYGNESSRNDQSTVVLIDEIEWGYLNPLRGDKSPGAADLWGDRTKNVATGMLVRFRDDFSSPPHIHNITYRGVVITGLLHNDDPGAETMWLSTGSFWTQPAGQNHITAASASENLIYLEIDSGPYLVKPSHQQFDNGERPLNMHASNLVWSSAIDSNASNNSGVKLASLWEGEDTVSGFLVKLPRGFQGKLLSNAEKMHAVVVSGAVSYSSFEKPKSLILEPGSYFSSTGDFAHSLSVSDESQLYLRLNGKFELIADKLAPDVSPKRSSKLKITQN